jgi:hypothetical protein
MVPGVQDPDINPGQEVHQLDVQELFFSLDNMRSLVPWIEEVMEFQSVVRIKGNLGKFN